MKLREAAKSDRKLRVVLDDGEHDYEMYIMADGIQKLKSNSLMVTKGRETIIIDFKDSFDIKSVK